MPPPSRGRWKGGALAPSTRVQFFSTDELLLRGFGGAAGEEDFNRFDAALCDVWPACFLTDALAVRLALATLDLEAFDDFAAGCRPGEVLGDFLRDFLDIRLPFVAFGGSIIRLLRTPPPWRIRARGWASLTASEYGYKEFDAPPVRSLSELLPPNDEQQD